MVRLARARGVSNFGGVALLAEVSGRAEVAFFLQQRACGRQAVTRSPV